MPDRKKLAQEWTARGDNDLKTAKLAFQAGAPTDTLAILLQQASEKYIKGYLVFRGWHLKRTHDLRELVQTAVEYDPSFKDYIEMARLLTAYYLDYRYPPGPPADYPRQDIANMLEQTEKLTDKINKSIK